MKRTMLNLTMMALLFGFVVALSGGIGMTYTASIREERVPPRIERSPSVKPSSSMQCPYMKTHPAAPNASTEVIPKLKRIA